MDDTRIVELFWNRSEIAIDETKKKYGRYCHYIAWRILNNDEDAKEIVNDTYMKVWNAIPPKQPNPLKPFIGTICRNLALNAHAAQNAQKRSNHMTLVLDELVECIPSNDNGAEIGESIALRDAINGFLHSLPRKTRNVFVRRYWYASAIAEIAEEYAMKDSAVAMLLLRTRNKLKEHLETEGFYI